MPNLWMAPLHGITLYQFRNCFIRHNGGLNAAIAPFMTVQCNEKLNVRKWKDFDPVNNTSMDVIPQLMGIVPAHFADTMRAVHEQFGIRRFNWNLGCPMPPIVRKRRGCGLMPFPDDVESVVETACSLPFRFSVKLRLGLHSPSEGMEIIQRLNDYPLEFVVIHPRLGIQQYEGTPDLDAFSAMLEACQHPVIYSGDIFTVDDFLFLRNKFPQIQHWMLGRGLLRNPFLAEQIQSAETGEHTIPSCDEEKLRFNEFYEDLEQTLLSFKTESGTLSMLKELWHYFASYYNLSARQLHDMLVCQSLDDFNRVRCANLS